MKKKFFAFTLITGLAAVTVTAQSAGGSSVGGIGGISRGTTTPSAGATPPPGTPGGRVTPVIPPRSVSPAEIVRQPAFRQQLRGRPLVLQPVVEPQVVLPPEVEQTVILPAVVESPVARQPVVLQPVVLPPVTEPVLLQPIVTPQIILPTEVELAQAGTVPPPQTLPPPTIGGGPNPRVVVPATNRMLISTNPFQIREQTRVLSNRVATGVLSTNELRPGLQFGVETPEQFRARNSQFEIVPTNQFNPRLNQFGLATNQFRTVTNGFGFVTNVETNRFLFPTGRTNLPILPNRPNIVTNEPNVPNQPNLPPPGGITPPLPGGPGGP